MDHVRPAAVCFAKSLSVEAPHFAIWFSFNDIDVCSEVAMSLLALKLPDLDLHILKLGRA